MERVESRKLFWLVDGHALRRASLCVFLMPWAHKRRLDLRQFADPAEAEGGEVPEICLLSTGSRSLRDEGVRRSLDGIASAAGDVPVILMPERMDEEDVRDALHLGVRGLLPTSIEPRVAIAALDLVLAGGCYFPVEVPAGQPFPLPSPGPATGLREAPLAAEGLDMPLTDRQNEVLRSLGAGASNKEIARQLSISEATVKIHVRHLMRKYGVSNRTQVAILAMRKTAEVADLRSPRRA